MSSLETYWIVYAGGITSPSLRTLPDVGTWIEDNMNENIKQAQIKRFRVDRGKVMKEVQSEVQKLEERLNRAKEKLASLNGG